MGRECGGGSEEWRVGIEGSGGGGGVVGVPKSTCTVHVCATCIYALAMDAWYMYIYSCKCTNNIRTTMYTGEGCGRTYLVVEVECEQRSAAMFIPALCVWVSEWVYM